MTEIFAERLQKIRKSKHLSQSGLATRIGLKPAAVSHFETGQRKPPFETLMKLADALSVSIDYLCGRDADRATTITGKLLKDFERLSLKDQDVVQDMVQVLLRKNPRQS
jgi:transcriptional regulator with XRE-family HTH domain